MPPEQSIAVTCCLVFLLAALAGCDESTGPSTHPPVITDIRAPSEVLVGDMMIASVDCTDADGDRVSVVWSPVPTLQRQDGAYFGVVLQFQSAGPREIAATCSSADGSVTARTSIVVQPAAASVRD